VFETFIAAGNQKFPSRYESLRNNGMAYNFYFYTNRKECKMRTNIVLDDKLIERAQKLTGIKTKREVVHEALLVLILLNEQAEIQTLRGKLLWDGNLNDQRQSRLKVH